MNIKKLKVEGFEEVLRCDDPRSGLHAIIAIHSTTLGPALGGTRMWPYASDNEALTDVLRLSRGMTYKAAGAGLPLGGGKAVIIGDSKRDKSPALFEAFGAFVESLSGRYITTEDVGITVADIDIIRTKTKYVVGTDRAKGGSGDPSPYTARGVFLSMKECARRVFGSDSLKGKTVAVQGVGSVGTNVVKHLVQEGAIVTASDVVREKTEKLVNLFPNVTIVPQEEILILPCDIFAPCALGAVINDRTFSQLRCRMVVGAANNQLATLEHGDRLAERGVLYAPDYIINAGGLINVFCELDGYREERSLQYIQEIPRNLSQVFEKSEKDGISPARAADRWVEKRLAVKSLASSS
ncbi:MAG: Glu/Leu/Phe/Val dehydrogenase [Deltaproteobacteria bacterium]|nr:Glu/Leu/Phe/Val dehydrogenase [Deltaproteobacteria bacterium]